MCASVRGRVRLYPPPHMTPPHMCVGISVCVYLFGHNTLEIVAGGRSKWRWQIHGILIICVSVYVSIFNMGVMHASSVCVYGLRFKV